MINGKILDATVGGHCVLRFVGDIRVNLCSTLDALITKICDTAGLKSITVDLSQTQCIDSTSLGLLAKIAIKSEPQLGRSVTIVSTNEDITAILMSMGFDAVFDIQSHLQPLDSRFDRPIQEIPARLVDYEEADSEQVCGQVLEAHRHLMSLNKANEKTFNALVKALEEEQLRLRGRPVNHVLGQIVRAEDQIEPDCPRIDPRYMKPNLVAHH